MGRTTIDEKEKVKSVNVYVKYSIIEKNGGLKNAQAKAKHFLEKEALENPVNKELTEKKESRLNYY